MTSIVPSDNPAPVEPRIGLEYIASQYFEQRRMFDALVTPTFEDVDDFLEGFTTRLDGKLHPDEASHVIPYGGMLYLAKHDFALEPLYGAKAIHILIPEKVDVRIDSESGFKGFGHNTLLFSKGSKQDGHKVRDFKVVSAGMEWLPERHENARNHEEPRWALITKLALGKLKN